MQNDKKYFDGNQKKPRVRKNACPQFCQAFPRRRLVVLTGGLEIPDSGPGGHPENCVLSAKKPPCP